MAESRRSLPSGWVVTLAIGGVIALAALLGRGGDDESDATRSSDLEVVQVGELPPQVRKTLDRIDSGGPYPYADDGQRFGNVEGRLPERPKGYYREYTVETPGSSDRGPRHLVTGNRGEVYYTDDHYASFVKVEVKP